MSFVPYNFGFGFNKILATEKCNLQKQKANGARKCRRVGLEVGRKMGGGGNIGGVSCPGKSIQCHCY